MTHRLPWFSAALAALLLSALAWAQTVAVPPLSARVTDLTGTLSRAERSALEAKLAAFEQNKGSQVAVLLVPTTGEETIEQYGIRVAEQWKLGRAGVDDGVLLLVAKDDRRLRIEVGYGLEGAIPDAVAKRIIAEVITPYFRSGDYYTGIAAGVDALLAVIEGEPLPEPSRRQHEVAPDTMGRLVAPLLAGVVIGLIVRALMGRGAGGMAAALVAGLATLLLVNLVASLFAGLFAAFFVAGAGAGRHRGFGGWGGGVGGLGGGGFGGGGFGGGGGGFGGGGASGGW